MAIIIDERPYRGITIKAGNHIVKANDLDEKALALAKQFDTNATEQRERRDPRIIDERPYGGITIKAGNHIVKANDLDEKTLAFVKKLEDACT